MLPAADDDDNGSQEYVFLEPEAHSLGTAPLRARLVSAFVNFLLSSYASVTLLVLQLLTCVHVPGTSPKTAWLFIQGTRQCHLWGWQLPLVVAMAVLVAIPLAVPLLSTWASTWVHAAPQVPPSALARLAVDVKWGTYHA